MAALCCVAGGGAGRGATKIQSVSWIYSGHLFEKEIQKETLQEKPQMWGLVKSDAPLMPVG